MSTLLERIKTEARNHSFHAYISGDLVVIEIPYVNVNTKEEGVESVKVKTFRELYIALGY